jgi:hypothetical protein
VQQRQPRPDEFAFPPVGEDVVVGADRHPG